MAEELTLTDQHFDPPKTITGSYGAVHLQRCSGIILEIELRHERINVEHERPFTIDECDNIAVQNSDIASDDDSDHSDDVYGLYVTNSTNIKLLDSELHDLVRAAVFRGVNGLEVVGNLAHTIRSDAFDFIGVKRVKINDNQFQDFNPIAGDHADAIQFWLTETYPVSEDVEIAGNTILIGDGSPYQCIFIETKNPAFTFRRFRIARNVMYNGSGHGITIYQGGRYCH